MLEYVTIAQQVQSCCLDDIDDLVIKEFSDFALMVYPVGSIQIVRTPDVHYRELLILGVAQPSCEGYGLTYEEINSYSLARNRIITYRNLKLVVYDYSRGRVKTIPQRFLEKSYEPSANRR